MPQTESQRRAKQKYDAKNYKTIGIKCPIDEYKVIGKIAESNSLTASMFSRNCIKYCINNNIKFSDTDTTAKQLFDLRTQHGYTPIQTAAELGVDYSTYTKYESGTEKIPLNILFKICKLFDVPQSYFGVSSDLVAIGNKGFAVQNTDSLEILDVTSEEFEMLKGVLEAYRKKE